MTNRVIKKLVREAYNEVLMELSPKTIAAAAGKLAALGQTKRASEMMAGLVRKFLKKKAAGGTIKNIYTTSRGSSGNLDVVIEIQQPKSNKDGITGVRYVGRKNRVYFLYGPQMKEKALSTSVSVDPNDAELFTDIISSIVPDANITIPTHFVTSHLNDDVKMFKGKPIDFGTGGELTIRKIGIEKTSGGNSKLAVSAGPGYGFGYILDGNREKIRIWVKGGRYRSRAIEIPRSAARTITRIIHKFNPDSKVSVNTHFKIS